METESTSRLPIIAILGRPNVGKSSLFNRLIGRRHAITSKTAGTTRDRIYFHAKFNDLTVILVDTGGLEYGKKENIEADVQIQINLAINEADLIIFMVDAKEGLTIEDHNAVDKLRKSNKKILFVANKIDNKGSEDQFNELLSLGFGEPIAISAYHDINVDSVVTESYSYLLEQGFKPVSKEEQAKKKGKISICFLGKPNVGKSSMVNALLGKEKIIVSEIPGTTRDAIDTEIIFNNKKFNLIDTAGLRRRGKIQRGLEKLSSFRSLDAIERSDIVCLILDYSEGIRKQDQHISSYALEAGKGLILIVNKSDLMEDKQEDEQRIIRILKKRFDFLPWAPVLFVSALKRKNIVHILELSQEIYDERYKMIDQEELTEFMKEITYKHLPPSVGRRIPKFYALEQDAVNPPSFVYWVNDPASIHFSYRRYLENELRKKFGFTGTAIRLYFKEKGKSK
jgi:GTP-binding protein